MTAHQLAKLLLSLPDLPVHFSYNYGDRSNTMVAPAVEDVGTAKVSHSDYHSLPKLTGPLKGETVVVIS